MIHIMCDLSRRLAKREVLMFFRTASGYMLLTVPLRPTKCDLRSIIISNNQYRTSSNFHLYLEIQHEIIDTVRNVMPAGNESTRARFFLLILFLYPLLAVNFTTLYILYTSRHDV
jgi:hypothetical protein